VKINGRGGDWTCIFFVPEGAACAIYGQRPLECRLLKCWDTGDLLGAVGRDTLTRLDLLSQGDPARQLIALHERECPSSQVAAAVAGWRLDPENPEPRRVLTDLVRRDLAVRHHAVTDLGLPATVEFFVFGRPLFKQLAGFGVSILETAAAIDLVWPSADSG
ncbi:MAG: hypothetical protein OEV91_09220, partial [Desulfobulbaceae bacterium]|nr:hypothetical protein [Desulfobulbaceae bacterium]